MNGEGKEHDLSEDLEAIDVYIPKFRKSPDRTSPLKRTDANKSMELQPKIKKNEILHKKEYTFIKFFEGTAQLMGSDFRLISIPEELLPVTLSQGSSLILTISLDQKANT